MNIFDQSSELYGKFLKNKEEVIKRNLNMYNPKDWALIQETSHDWALDQIVQFQEDNNLSKCEVISVNNVVFVFSDMAWRTTEDDGSSYKCLVEQKYAVFKKPLDTAENV